MGWFVLGYCFVLSSFASSAAPRSHVGSAVVLGRGSWCWMGDHSAGWTVGAILPRSLENCISSKETTVANPVSIFSGGVVRRWRGMPRHASRLLPSLLSFRSVQVTNCLLLLGFLLFFCCFFFFPHHSDTAALSRSCQPLCLSFPIHACWGGMLDARVGDGMFSAPPRGVPWCYCPSPPCLALLLVSQGWHPHIPHVCCSHGCRLLPCQLLPSCANPP